MPAAATIGDRARPGPVTDADREPTHAGARPKATRPAPKGIAMAYFVTGATGFIGSYLVANLVERGGPIYVLVRQQSLDRLVELREAWGADDKRIIAIVGDLDKPKLGVSAADLRKLK